MTRTRYFRTSGARRRRLLRHAAIGTVLLLVVGLGWRWSRDHNLPGPDAIAGSRGAAPDRGHSRHSNQIDAAWPNEGQAAIAVDGLGKLGSSGGDQPVPIASLAKVMTAYLVLRDDPLEPGDEGFGIEIGPGDAEDVQRRIELNQSVVAVEVGEVLSERDALEALLLPSANNVAALLAIHEAGTIEAFVAEMNEAAAELGMTNTRYTDPSGFEDTTVSTASDQLKLGRAAMVDPTFAEIVALPSAWLPVVGEVANFNELVGHDGFVGIKTGSDQAAGGCLLFAREIDVDSRPRLMFGAVLGQREGDLLPSAFQSAEALAASVSALSEIQG